MSGALAILDRPLEAPIRRWPKLLAFAVGLAAALGAYLLVRPRLATWRSLREVSSVGLAHTVPPARPPDTPGEIDTRSSLGTGNPENAASADPRAREAQKATRSVRRHRPRHRS
jgi:hypothetical protein